MTNPDHILLLIDDNPLLRGMYEAAFTKRGLKVFFSHDGESGIKIAKEKKPHVILLDLLMPGINGFEVLKRLKEDKDTENIKVIILSIISDQQHQKKAEKLGANDYLIKSELKLNEIVDRVMKHFPK
ncbi:MAG: response regulator [Candidatus Brennerbacteria bacterium]|nr:response regulator [Candidatus Brennerbacteria bacterium]